MTSSDSQPPRQHRPRPRGRRLIAVAVLALLAAVAVSAANGIACDKIPAWFGSTAPSVQVRKAEANVLEGRLCIGPAKCEPAVLVHGLLPAHIGQVIEERAGRAHGGPIWICLHSEGGARAVALTGPLPSNVRTCVSDVVDAAGVRHPALCASACAWLWLAGRQRELFGSSTVGFHRPYIYESAWCAPGNYFAAAEAFVRGWITDRINPDFAGGAALSARGHLRMAGMAMGPSEAYYIGAAQAAKLGLQTAALREAVFIASGDNLQATANK